MSKAIVLTILLAISELSYGAGCEDGDGRCLEVCSMLSFLNQTMAEQAENGGVSARETEQYKSFSSADDELSRGIAPVMANIVDALSGRLSTHLISDWTSFGYCRGYEEFVITGPHVEFVEKKCRHLGRDKIAVGCMLEAIDDVEIEITQMRLNELGYNAGPAEGVVGNKTKRAIREFQRENNLTLSPDNIPNGALTMHLISQ